METERPSRSGHGEEVSEAAPGTAPALTGGAGPMAVRVFPGLPGQVREARRWVRALAAAAGSQNPDDPELVAAELFANAVLHTRSGLQGGKVTIAVTADGVIHVHDYGTAGPCPGLSAGRPEDGSSRGDFGRGLQITAALCTGLAHLPAAWCPAAGPGDPAVRARGCCTCCRPGTWLQAPAAPPVPGGHHGLAVTQEGTVLR